MNAKSDLSERIRRSVRIHNGGMLRLAYAYVRSTQDAEDVVQEVFLSFFKHAPVFLDDEHEKAWLLKATVNRCKNLLKSGWYKRRDSLPESLSYVPAQESAVLSEVMALDEMYRMPIHLYYYEGYAIREIAQIMDEKPATIGTRLARGRELLKQRIGGMESV